jgi:hypothetical protein
MVRNILFLSIAYLTGIQGFLICAPYLVLFGGSVHIIRARRRQRA